MLNAELDLKSSAAEPLAIECLECHSLTSGHEIAKRSYAMAVDVLFATGYRFRDNDYIAMKSSVEKTYAQREIAQAQLDRHTRSCPRQVADRRN